MKKVECFKIKLYGMDDGNLWDLRSLDLVHEIFFDRRLHKCNPIIIVADPFLFVHNDYLYLFYEEKRMETPGVLKMIRTSNLIDWSEPIVVLQESFHLSYPYVFEDDGIVYMIPETCAAGEVRLYKADNDELSHFSQDCILLSHDDKKQGVTIDFSDSSLFKHTDGLYYLMTTLNSFGENNLLMYVSDNLRGPYIEHPMSPIVKSSKYGRNAGCLFVYKDSIYRVAQDCVKRYGDNVHLLEVMALNKELYQERLIKDNILDASDAFYKEGGHQFNVTKYKGKYIVATDAKEYHLFLLHRIIKKISRLL